MESIIFEIEQSIALKKKQIEEHQAVVNDYAMRSSDCVRLIYQLSNQIECLDRDLNQLKKNSQDKTLVMNSGDMLRNDAAVNCKQVSRD